METDAQLSSKARPSRSGEFSIHVKPESDDVYIFPNLPAAANLVPSPLDVTVFQI